MKADTIGGITPAVLVQLKHGEKILAAHEIMLYKEPSVKLTRRTLKSLGVSTAHLLGMRALGDNEESYFLAEFEGPGNVTFSRDKGGEVRVMDLPAGQSVKLRQGHMICFDPTVHYNPMVLFQYPNPVPDANGNRSTVYGFADELTGPGTLVFQSNGNILSFNLGPQESLRTSTNALLMMSGTNRFSLNWLASGQMIGSASAQIPVMDVYGPGTVMVHSGW